MTSPRFLQVLVDVPLDTALEYRLDAAHQVDSRLAGLRCVVPLGRRRVVGLIAVEQSTSVLPEEQLKPIGRVLDEIGALDSHWFEFTRFAADYYQHPWGEVALSALPPALRALPGPRYEAAIRRLRNGGLRNGALTDGEAGPDA